MYRGLLDVVSCIHLALPNFVKYFKKFNCLVFININKKIWNGK